jgi:hypothetical protein
MPCVRAVRSISYASGWGRPVSELGEEGAQRLGALARREGIGDVSAVKR